MIAALASGRSCDSPAHRAAASLRPLHVLVAESDAHARDALRGAIAAFGHDCQVAASTSEALAAHRAAPADVFIADWRTLGLECSELCRRVRSLHRRAYTYVLFTGEAASKRELVDAVRAGADDYLSKPIEIADLEARLLAASRVVAAYRALATRNADLRRDRRTCFRSARVDAVTRVANRLRLDEDLEALQGLASRYRRRASIAMCDVDGFKRYNDHYGHLAGDYALRRIAHAIRTSVRRSDAVYRYGGDEFLVVLHEQGQAEAAVAMARVRAAVESLSIAHSPQARRAVLTLSVGLAPVLPGGEHSVVDAIAEADKALYRAKAGGGNTLAVEPDGDLDPSIGQGAEAATRGRSG
jgi:diguanylate cyclase (GGDEF)-like protein